MANTITSKELRERQDDYTYVDVREADELEEGMIDGAMNIPLGQLIRKARHGDLDDLKRKKIVTYCSGGYRGIIAADELNKLGFDTVNIEGGYSAYKNYGNKSLLNDSVEACLGDRCRNIFCALLAQIYIAPGTTFTPDGTPQK